MGNKKKNRNYYIDNIRGLATISVVFIHTVFWSGSYWFVPVYIIALLVSYMLIKQYSPKKLFTYFTKIEINFYNFNYSILFFISCILIGYLGAMKKYKYLYIVLSLVSILIYLFIYLSKKIVLQDYKFPVGIPYVVASMISLFLILHFFHKSTFLNLKIPILSFVGCNSLYFYMSQGIGASILFYILPFLKFSWQLKMIFAFIINIIASLIIGYLFIWVEKQFNKIIRRGNLNVES